MQPFRRVAGIGLPIDRENVDTDMILPQRWLVTVERTGLGEGFFGGWRYDADGGPRPGCVLNQPGYQGAAVVVAGANYGCGSSREHAVWAHLDYGIRAVIAPSYGPIFFENSLKNGLLPVVLPAASVARLLRQMVDAPGSLCEVDLELSIVVGPDGASYSFALDEGRRQALLAGADEIALTLRLDEEIAAFQRGDRTRRPWIW